MQGKTIFEHNYVSRANFEIYSLKHHRQLAVFSGILAGHETSKRKLHLSAGGFSVSETRHTKGWHDPRLASSLLRYSHHTDRVI